MTKQFVYIICCVFFLIPPALTAQDAEETKSPWIHSWNFNLNGSQASYSNWSQGGVSSIAGAASTIFDSKYTNEEFANTSRINLKFGQTRLNGDDVRKTDDLIRLTNKTNYFLKNKKYSAFVDIEFRTQFAKGFDDDYEEVISKFMAPGYITESAGLSYKPADYFSIQLGLGLKQTVVADTSLSTLYGVNEGDKIRGEGGLTIALGMEKNIAENIIYSGELSTFTSFVSAVSSTDVNFTNEISGKINGYLSTNLQFVLLFDDDVNEKLQVKQVLAVGLNFTIL